MRNNCGLLQEVIVIEKNKLFKIYLEIDLERLIDVLVVRGGKIGRNQIMIFSF